jgi:TPR repeat protein
LSFGNRNRREGKVSTVQSEYEAGLIAYQKRDFEGALRHWRPLADRGHSESQAWLGALNFNAEGVPLNYEVAAAWYRKAAEGGNIFAQNNLATMYAAGQGVEKDLAEAARWLTRAAERGDAFALFNLASMHDKGDGVQKDPATAANLYKKAAELGNVQSQMRLGYMLAKGIGVGANRVEAFLWLSLAAHHGIGTALIELESIVGAMSAEERLQGQRLLEARRSKPPVQSSD